MPVPVESGDSPPVEILELAQEHCLVGVVPEPRARQLLAELPSPSLWTTALTSSNAACLGQAAGPGSTDSRKRLVVATQAWSQKATAQGSLGSSSLSSLEGGWGIRVAQGGRWYESESVQWAGRGVASQRARISLCLASPHPPLRGSVRARPSEAGAGPSIPRPAGRLRSLRPCSQGSRGLPYPLLGPKSRRLAGRADSVLERNHLLLSQGRSTDCLASAARISVLCHVLRGLAFESHAAGNVLVKQKPLSSTPSLSLLLSTRSAENGTHCFSSRNLG